MLSSKRIKVGVLVALVALASLNGLLRGWKVEMDQPSPPTTPLPNPPTTPLPNPPTLPPPKLQHTDSPPPPRRSPPREAHTVDVMHTGVLKRYDDAPPPPRELVDGAVILILYGGRFGGAYFQKYALPRLEAHFLRCFPYPLHIFHEADVPAHELAALRELVPSSNVTFELIRFALPKHIRERDVEVWSKDGVQKKFQGKGYRVMCRFWTGPVWTLPSLRGYKRYMRLDTDSIIPKPVPSDPFRRFVREGCEYGFNRLKRENPHVLTQLWETTERWLAGQPPGVAERVRRAVATPTYHGPMYYNNFEMGSFGLKQHPVYQSFFSFIDTNEPYGIFRYRWGDAPLHTVGIAAAITGKMCNFTRTEFPYFHNPSKGELRKLAVDTTGKCPV